MLTGFYPSLGIGYSDFRYTKNICTTLQINSFPLRLIHIYTYKNEMPKVRPGVTVDADIWRRCKALSDKFTVINWSEIVEASLVEFLILFEEVVGEIPHDKESSDQMVDRVLLYFQAKYHSSLGEVYSTKSKAKLPDTQIDVQEQPK